MAHADYHIPISSIVASLGLDRFRCIGDDLADALWFATQHIGVRQRRGERTQAGPGVGARRTREHLDLVEVSDLPPIRHGLCSANTRSGRCGHQQIFVMQATQQRSGAHHEALADPMAGLLSRRRRDI